MESLFYWKDQSSQRFNLSIKEFTFIFKLNVKVQNKPQCTNVSTSICTSECINITAQTRSVMNNECSVISMLLSASNTNALSCQAVLALVLDRGNSQGNHQHVHMSPHPTSHYDTTTATTRHDERHTSTPTEDISQQRSSFSYRQTQSVDDFVH